MFRAGCATTSGRLNELALRRPVSAGANRARLSWARRVKFGRQSQARGAKLATLRPSTGRELAGSLATSFAHGRRCPLSDWIGHFRALWCARSRVAAPVTRWHPECRPTQASRSANFINLMPVWPPESMLKTGNHMFLFCHTAFVVCNARCRLAGVILGRPCSQISNL